MLESKQDQSQRLYVHPMARVWAATSTGFLQSLLVYPFDRYKNNVMRTLPPTSMHWKEKILRNMISPQYPAMNFSQRMNSSYNGYVGYGVYKIINTGIKLGVTKPTINYVMDSRPLAPVIAELGKNHTQLLVSFACGGGLGIVEAVVTNPIDYVKLQCQRKNLPLNHVLSSVSKEINQKGINVLFNGVKATAGRNFFGSGGLFAGTFATYQMLNVQDNNLLTPAQSFISAAVGHVTMILASHPHDLVKVFHQMPGQISGATITTTSVPAENMCLQNLGFFKSVNKIVETQGLQALKNGLGAKLIGSGLKGTLAMMFYDWFVVKLNGCYGAESSLKFRHS